MQDKDEAPAPEDLWARRTRAALGICGDAMHSTPLATKFKNASEYSEHVPSCELRIHDVRHCPSQAPGLTRISRMHLATAPYLARTSPLRLAAAPRQHLARSSLLSCSTDPTHSPHHRVHRRTTSI